MRLVSQSPLPAAALTAGTAKQKGLQRRVAPTPVPQVLPNSQSVTAHLDWPCLKHASPDNPDIWCLGVRMCCSGCLCQSANIHLLLLLHLRLVLQVLSGAQVVQRQ